MSRRGLESQSAAGAAGWGARLRRLRRAQLLRYLVAGGWNTLFGYAAFAALTYALSGRVPYPYMVASVVSNVAAITMAFVTYKFFVFGTRGNYLREYLRVYVVYGATALVGLALLPAFVALVGLVVRQSALVPYVAQALLIPVVVTTSFVGHRRFSFRRTREADAGSTRDD